MRILIYGAGQIGRGLIGRIFCNAGYRVVFVEKRVEVVRRLSTNGYYPLNTGNGLQWVGPVAACMLSAEDESLAVTDIVVCCVRVENMEEVANRLASVLVGRPKDAKRIDVLVVENMPHADLHLKNLTQGLANETINNLIFNQGIAECIIPEVDLEVQALDPALANGDSTGYLVVPDTLEKGLEHIKGIFCSSDMDFSWALKWYCHCAFHAVLGYVGIARGFTHIDEVVDDKLSQSAITHLMREIVWGLERSYPRRSNEIWDRVYNVEHFGLAHPAVRDTCARVTRDSARKVAPGERLQDLRELVGEHPLVVEAIRQAERMAGK